MGLKCSLLGHEYGEPETEREREERGDEVVETVRTVEYCERCGAERVVSENTEVRSVRHPPESLADESDDTEAADESGTDDSGLASAVERVENESESAIESAAAAEAEIDEDGIDIDENASPAEDDAVILTDDGEEVTPERERGEWPSSEDTREGERPDEETPAVKDVEEDATVIEGDTGPTDDEETSTGDEEDAEDDAVFIDETVSAEDDGSASTAWPEQDGEDEGFAAEPATSGGTDVSFGGGLAPDEESERTVESSGDEEEVDPRGGIASAGPIETDRGSESANTDGDELVCPECGERTAVSGSSLRAGDICPDCHRGYLAEAPESA
ncbi:DUF7093 family protein [Halarchaeum sp. P4]|uniref:DUF7093 family protein n=1 Tax=Halarchaeum sp. P4 TaxID=3421639 RepID=UPI003EBC2815